MKIAFFDSKPYDIEWFKKANIEYGYEIKFYETRLNHDTVMLASGFNAIIAFVNDAIDAMVINTLCEQGIRHIALRSAGYNNVDFRSAYKKVHITRVPDYSPNAVAEHAMALFLCLNRKIHKAYIRVRDNNFSINGLMGMDLNGKTAGVIGTGKIGRVFINICRGFNMYVLAYDVFPSEDKNIEYVSLEKLYSQSDIISLHCPLTPDTKHMINEDSLSKMKKGVFIINTSRGALIDTESLIQGLKSQKIGGACLDVYEEESDYFFEDLSEKIILDDVLARLMTLPNVLITSHQGFFTREAEHNIARTTLENIREFETGSFMKNEICYACLQKDSASCRHKEGKNCF